MTPKEGITAAEIAELFMISGVFSNGTPEKFIADNGGLFTSKFFIDVCQIMPIQANFVIIYQPHENGQAKRYNHSILPALRTYVTSHPRKWYLYTDALICAYNFQPHTSTAIVPFQLVLYKARTSLPHKPVRTEAEL